MRTILIILGITAMIVAFAFSGFFKRTFQEMMLPDQNPQLVSYLQGTWAVEGDSGLVFQIKRDSLIQHSGDTVKTVNNLYYRFSEAASKYFKKDSSFDFHSPVNREASFRLVEINPKTRDTLAHLLCYVSRSRLDWNTNGNTLHLVRLQ